MECERRGWEGECIGARALRVCIVLVWCALGEGTHQKLRSCPNLHVRVQMHAVQLSSIPDT